MKKIEIEISYDGKEAKVECTDKSKIFSIKELKLQGPFYTKVECVEVKKK